VALNVIDLQQQPPPRGSGGTLKVRFLGPAIGAEVSGVDLSRPLADDAVAAIRAALAERGVVFFRDQRLTPEQHVAFAERFHAGRKGAG
jgi:alpha-ketoglutarate-dependent taurine dioxygenase